MEPFIYPIIPNRFVGTNFLHGQRKQWSSIVVYLELLSSAYQCRLRLDLNLLVGTSAWEAIINLLRYYCCRDAMSLTYGHNDFEEDQDLLCHSQCPQTKQQGET